MNKISWPDYICNLNNYRLKWINTLNSEQLKQIWIFVPKDFYMILDCDSNKWVICTIYNDQVLYLMKLEFDPFRCYILSIKDNFFSDEDEKKKKVSFHIKCLKTWQIVMKKYVLSSIIDIDLIPRYINQMK